MTFTSTIPPVDTKTKAWLGWYWTVTWEQERPYMRHTITGWSLTLRSANRNIDRLEHEALL